MQEQVCPGHKNQGASTVLGAGEHGQAQEQG
jgi:hypothetical protein